MNSGWIKLHRKILENEHLARDDTACLLFVKLLLLVDKTSGQYTTGRYKLALFFESKPITIYKALKRLEKWNIIELSSNNKNTHIRICNWQEYQSFSNNEVTTKEQQSNNKVTHNKNKELRIKNNSNTNVLLVDARRAFDLYIQLFNKNPKTTKLTESRRQKLQLRVKQNGYEQLEAAIRNTAGTSFYRGDNDRGWQADIDYIIRSQEQVEKLSQMAPKASSKVTHRPVNEPLKSIQLSDEERAIGRAKLAEIRKNLFDKGIVKSIN